VLLNFSERSANITLPWDLSEAELMLANDKTLDFNQANCSLSPYQALVFKLA
jgi:hypothetical protein